MTHEKIPSELKYTESHEWIREDDSGSYTVGISEHAQHLLGDLVFVELPRVGDSFEKGDEIGVVESVKAASDVYAPISGEVTEVNTALPGEPDLINKDPYGAGWMFKISPSIEHEIEELLDHEEYAKIAEE